MLERPTEYFYSTSISNPSATAVIPSKIAHYIVNPCIFQLTSWPLSKHAALRDGQTTTFVVQSQHLAFCGIGMLLPDFCTAAGFLRCNKIMITYQRNIHLIWLQFTRSCPASHSTDQPVSLLEARGHGLDVWIQDMERQQFVLNNYGGFWRG